MFTVGDCACPNIGPPRRTYFTIQFAFPYLRLKIAKGLRKEGSRVVRGVLGDQTLPRA